MTNINKYQSGKIYKITNTINSEVYVGSSTIDLEDRMIKHKTLPRKNRMLQIYIN